MAEVEVGVIEKDKILLDICSTDESDDSLNSI